MRKAAMIAGGVAVAAAAGWAAFWTAGRAEVASRLDIEIARLSAQGIEVAHGAREIGGFPFAYEVALTDVTLNDPARGLAASLPLLTGRATAADPETLTLDFPERFAMTLGPGALPVEVESEGLRLTVSGPPAGVVEARLGAPSVLLVAADPARAQNGAIEFQSMDISAALPPALSGRPATLEARIGRIDVLLTDAPPAPDPTAGSADAPPDTRQVRLDATIDEVFLTGSATGGDTAAIVGALAAGAAVPGDGALSLELRTGLTRSGITVTGAPDSGALTVEAREIRSAIDLRDGAVTSASDARALRLEILPESPDARVRGALGIGQLTFGHRAPGRPEERMRPLGLRALASDIAPDDVLWQAIDPDARLDRAPGRLAVDLEGTARLLPAEDGSFPAEIGNLVVEDLSVDGLGARIAAAGALEFRQPQNLPEGTITVTFTDTMPAIASLLSAGLIDIAQAQTAMMLAERYTEAGERPEELVAEIGFSVEGIAVNGLPLMPAP